jgi:hypothetical protein
LRDINVECDLARKEQAREVVRHASDVGCHEQVDLVWCLGILGLDLVDWIRRVRIRRIEPTSHENRDVGVVLRLDIRIEVVVGYELTI